MPLFASPASKVHEPHPALADYDHDIQVPIRRDKYHVATKPTTPSVRPSSILVTVALIGFLVLLFDAASIRTTVAHWGGLAGQRLSHKSLLFSKGEDRESEASLAYFIQISESTVSLLPRLLRVVWHPENVYVVHFDKKIPQWQRSHAEAALFKGNKQYTSNVKVMKSETVTYRGISMVLNLLSAMQAALDLGDDWKYFINISGSDYPLVSVENQRKLLGQEDFLERNRSFFSFSNQGWWEESKEYRFDLLYTDTSLSFNASESDVVAAHKEQPIAKTAAFTFVAAEAWMMLHREFVNFILTSSYARRMLLSFSYSLEPEEHYFASVAFNNKLFNESNVAHAMRHVQWVHEGKHSGQHPYYIDQREPDGKWTFRKEIEDSSCFFTRKIRVQDSGLLAYIDTHISGVGKKPVMKDVDGYLERVTNTLNCLANLPSGDFYGPCFKRRKKPQ